MISISGGMRPSDEPIPSSLKMSLRRRVEAIRPIFLSEAGFTEDELRKIMTNIPITRDEYQVMLFKVAKAEGLQTEARALSMLAQQPPPQQKETKIPSWLLITFGAVIFLLVVIIIVRRA
jgi:hypothetical protein